MQIQLIHRAEHKTQNKQHDNKEIPEELIKTFIKDFQVIKSSKWLEINDSLPENIEVVVDKHIAKFLGIVWNYRREQNKYKTHFLQITDFYETHLKGKQIGNSIHVLESGLGQVFGSQVWRSSVVRNVLEFGGGRAHFNAYMGLKEYGPLSKPVVNSSAGSALIP